LRKRSASFCFVLFRREIQEQLLVAQRYSELAPVGNIKTEVLNDLFRQTVCKGRRENVPPGGVTEAD